MRYNEIKLVETRINEASGIFNRQPGQMFKHGDTGHELEFIDEPIIFTYIQSNHMFLKIR